MSSEELSRRERKVLEAVIRSYVETAEPAGSRSLGRRFGLGVSPATIRNTMSDLEEKGFLSHPHTSAGRVPTNKAYRVYVDWLLGQTVPRGPEHEQLEQRLIVQRVASPIEAILRRAAQSLGVLTQELGVAVGPRLDRSILQRIELVRVAADRLLLVLTLGGNFVRTVFVDVRGDIADTALTDVTAVLNERLAGLTLAEVRASLTQRLRDTSAGAHATELLNIFVEEGSQLIDRAMPASEDTLVLGQASLLAEQPEFAAASGMRRLLELTEKRETIAEAIRARAHSAGISITIGNEHEDPRLEDFTVVTAEYHAGGLAGVIGVIGPTRMPYDKVISLVSHTSQLLSDLL